MNKGCLLVICISFLLLYQSCEEEEQNVIESVHNTGPIPRGDIPYLSPPQVYFAPYFSSSKFGVTILDTLTHQYSNQSQAVLTTFWGDSEKVDLLAISGTFDDGYFGIGCNMPLTESTQRPKSNNGILEINSSMDKISLAFNSINRLGTTYSIMVSNHHVYYPQRWIDRSP